MCCRWLVRRLCVDPVGCPRSFRPTRRRSGPGLSPCAGYHPFSLRAFDDAYHEVEPSTGRSYEREALAISKLRVSLLARALKLVEPRPISGTRPPYADMYAYLFQLFAHYAPSQDPVATFGALDTGLVLATDPPTFVNALAARAVWEAMRPRMTEDIMHSSEDFAVFTRLVRRCSLLLCPQGSASLADHGSHPGCLLRG